MSNESAAAPPKTWSQIRVLRAIWIAAEVGRDGHKEFLRQFGLNMAEFDVLAALGNTEGLRMKDIAAGMMTSASASNVTRVCGALEKRGLVTRVRSPHSDREVIARLTPEGQHRFEEIFPVIAAFTREFVDRRLSVEDQEQAWRSLRRFIDPESGTP